MCRREAILIAILSLTWNLYEAAWIYKPEAQRIEDQVFGAKKKKAGPVLYRRPSRPAQVEKRV